MKLGLVSRAFLTAAATLACSVAFAAPPSEAQVTQLLEASRSNEMLEGAMQQQLQGVSQQLVAHLVEGKNLSQAEQEKLSAVMQRAMASLGKSLTWEKVKPTFIKIYADTFDADDVQAMIDFYQSPAGKKMVEKTPQLMQNTMAAMQEIMLPALQEMEKEMAEAMKE